MTTKWDDELCNRVASMPPSSATVMGDLACDAAREILRLRAELVFQIEEATNRLMSRDRILAHAAEMSHWMMCLDAEREGEYCFFVTNLKCSCWACEAYRNFLVEHPEIDK